MITGVLTITGLAGLLSMLVCRLDWQDNNKLPTNTIMMFETNLDLLNITILLKMTPPLPFTLEIRRLIAITRFRDPIILHQVLCLCLLQQELFYP